jgi:hypothetical protein
MRVRASACLRKCLCRGRVDRAVICRTARERGRDQRHAGFAGAAVLITDREHACGNRGRDPTDVAGGRQARRRA